MQLERIAYPYVAGEFGLPFEKILETYKSKGRFSSRVESGNGSILSIGITSDLITIRDLDQNERYMFALLTADDVASFSIKTRDLIVSNGSETLGKAHPDMFAGKFVEFAISFFKENTGDVKACMGRWSRTSLNNSLLESGLNEHGDIIKAAKETWSGKVFTSLGFTELAEEDIHRNKQSYFVVALFRKP